MHNDLINLVTIDLLMFDEEMVYHVNLALVYDDSPNVDLAVTVSYEEAAVVVKDHGIWMLLIQKVFVPRSVSAVYVVFLSFLRRESVFKFVRSILWVHNESECFVFKVLFVLVDTFLRAQCELSFIVDAHFMF